MVNRFHIIYLIFQLLHIADLIQCLEDTGLNALQNMTFACLSFGPRVGRSQWRYYVNMSNYNNIRVTTKHRWT